MPKRAIVTGGAGFIGSHLCDFLVSQGSEVLCVDNLVTGSRRNIEHLLGKKNFEFLRHDITEPLELKGKADEVYNLASPASPVDYQNKPIETLMACSLGVKNMLELARGNSAKFLQASTSEIYGNPERHPQREDYWGNVNPVGPRSCYDEGKRFAEALVMTYRRNFSLSTRIVRIFNTYGPRMGKDDGRVMPNFITQALSGKKLTVYGSGKQTRSFCYISDMVRGITLAMQKDYHEPINLGNPDETEILALATKVIGLTNSASKISFSPLPTDDPERRKPDISLAKKVLGWQPEVGLDAGLEKTVEYFSRKKA